MVYKYYENSLFVHIRAPLAFVAAIIESLFETKLMWKAKIVLNVKTRNVNVATCMF